MKINKEGYKIIAVSGVCLAAVWLLLYYMIAAAESNWLIVLMSVLLVTFWFFIVSFFREPRRIKIHDADLVFSPCDGRVVVTEVVQDDEYFKGKRLQVSIFMSVTNVHIIKSIFKISHLSTHFIFFLFSSIVVIAILL